jgi:hypothetical protein
VRSTTVDASRIPSPSAMTKTPPAPLVRIEQQTGVVDTHRSPHRTRAIVSASPGAERNAAKRLDGRRTP